MKNKYFFTLILIISITKLNAQTEYPQDYFRNPLEIPIILAGTFGELRTAHFHFGIDLKTQQKEGLNVHTAAEGYVSRIKVSNWGYGKALYITHPNGYTTVYAHLKKFNENIEAYIRKNQYRLEKEEIQLFPKKDVLPIQTNEIIAYSGSTGGFIAPHLHFEIRNTKTEKIINPMHFGLTPKDTKKPIINHLRAYAFNDSSSVNKSNIALPINFKHMANGTYIASEVKAYGKIGFSLNTYDQQDGALNENGIYKLEMLVNGKKQFEHKVETFSFDESKYINLLIDYPYYGEHKRKYQKTYIHRENKLSTYDRKLGRGEISIEDGKTYQIQIRISDFAGNISELTVPVRGVKKTPVIIDEKKQTNYYIKKNQENSFKINKVKIKFPKNVFYNNLYLDITEKDSIISIHKPIVPLHKSYTITFDVSDYSKEQKDKMYIASVVKNKYYNYCSTTKNDSVFSTNTRSLGAFKLHSDKNPPIIEKCSFYENQNLSNYHSFSIKVTDKESGLKKYRGEIDGKWIRMELNVKTNKLTFDFDDIELVKGNHTFSLIAMDNIGNTRTFTSTFQTK